MLWYIKNLVNNLNNCFQPYYLFAMGKGFWFRKICFVINLCYFNTKNTVKWLEIILIFGQFEYIVIIVTSVVFQIV